ncbi:MAG: MarR family transcriptional regulator [Cyclobacteriaceae bacterium]
MKDELSTVVLFQIDQTSKIAKRYSQRLFDQNDWGLTVDQWVLLKIIEQHTPISQKELSNLSMRDTASITRTLDLLEKKKYVERQAIPNNRRQYNIELTKQGHSFIERHMDKVRETREKSLEGFTEKEISVLSDFLLRIQANMK